MFVRIGTSSRFRHPIRVTVRKSDVSRLVVVAERVRPGHARSPPIGRYRIPTGCAGGVPCTATLSALLAGTRTRTFGARAEITARG